MPTLGCASAKATSLSIQSCLIQSSADTTLQYLLAGEINLNAIL